MTDEEIIYQIKKYISRGAIGILLVTVIVFGVRLHKKDLEIKYCERTIEAIQNIKKDIEIRRKL